MARELPVTTGSLKMYRDRTVFKVISEGPGKEEQDNHTSVLSRSTQTMCQLQQGVQWLWSRATFLPLTLRMMTSGLSWSL